MNWYKMKMTNDIESKYECRILVYDIYSAI